MRAFPGTFLAALFAAGIAFAADEAVSSVQAPTAPADASLPGKVELEIVDCGGIPHYAFAGEAEDYFPGEGLETKAELYEEAVLDAKKRFYDILAGGDPACRVELSGLFVARHWAEGTICRVVCLVPVAAVHVTNGSPEEAPSSSQEAPLGKILDIGQNDTKNPTEVQYPTNP